MATYLQGVTDYIPDYQPFQPDLNFYANVLQTKQTQYDSNWKSLNNVYADLHNADLTHDLNIKKKDNLLKQIDFNLKRVSGLDLSLQQNVDQATQVFRPFYEDKYLMKDMAYTKNYSSTLSRALNLKNAQDEKMRGQYWDTGIKDMQYRREEFKNATLEETLNMGNTTYTPYVNAMEKYLKLAKDTGLSIDIKDVDESGLYFVREKNGKALMSPLQNLFMSAYANDPALQAVYSTQSYVKRKDYAEQYASKFNGNKNEAEKEYLRDQYKFLQNYSAKKNVENQETVTVTKNKINETENVIGTNDETIGSESYLESLNKALAIDQTVADHTEKLDKDINGGNSSTITTSGVTGDPNTLDMSDMALARLRVDGGTASILAQQDIIGAADIYAYKDYVYEKSANPVGLEGLRQQNALARIDYTHKLKTDEMKLNAVLERETNKIKNGIETGTMYYDKDGELQDVYGGTYARTFGSTSGSATDIQNALKDNKDQVDKSTLNYTSDYIGRTLTMLDNLASSNSKITNKELWSALSFLNPGSKEAYNKYKTNNGRELLTKLINQRNEDPAKFDLSFSKTNQILKLKKYMDGWAVKNKNSQAANQYLTDPSLGNIQQYVIFKEAAKHVEEFNTDIISRNLKQTLSSANLGLKKDTTREKVADAYLNYIQSTGNPTQKGFEKYIDNKLGLKGRYESNVQIMSKGEIESLGLRDTPKGPRADYISGLSIATGVDMDDLYETLSNSYLKTVTSGKIKSFKGQISNVGEGTYGYAGDKTTAIDVNLKNPSWGGFQDFHQVMSDINRIRFTQDPKKYAVTIGGITETAATSEEDKLDAALAKTILNELRTSAGPKSKYGTFTMGRSAVARENQNYGALMIIPPKELLEKYIKIKEGAKAGSVDTEKIEKIMKYGISFIAPKSEWTNDFFLQNELTPAQQLLNAKPIKYSSPFNAGRFEIKKQTNVPGVDYSMSSVYNYITEEGAITTLDKQLNLGKYGNNIDQLLNEQYNMLSEINKINQERYRILKKSGNTEIIKTIDNFFNKEITNSGFY